MTTQSYDIGDDVTESVEFSAASVDTDPTTVKFQYQQPDGVEVSLLYGTDTEVVVDDVGKYHVTLYPDIPGLWRFKWTGSGNLDAMFTGAFYINSGFGPILDKFAEVPMLAAYLGQVIDPADIIAIASLEAATQAIRRYCDQYISLVTDDTVTIDGSGSSTVLLPEFPVLNVTAVSEDFETDTPNVLLPTDFGFDKGGILTRRAGRFNFTAGGLARSGLWGDKRQSIQVTYTHGYDPVPSDIQLVCVAIAARGFAQDGATTENVGGYSVTYGGQPGTLTVDEKKILDRYRASRRK